MRWVEIFKEEKKSWKRLFRLTDKNKVLERVTNNCTKSNIKA